MATITDLSKIFEDIYTQKLPHCALCFRSEKETKLSAPLVFRKVLGALKYSDNAITPKSMSVMLLEFLLESLSLPEVIFKEIENEHICYMCEARANTVSKFVDMLQLALEIQRVFQKAEKMSGRYRKKRLQESIHNCHSNFSKFRQQTQFSMTDVLIVEAEAVEAVTCEEDSNPELRESTAPVETKPTDVKIETVVIDDEGTGDAGSNPPAADQTAGSSTGHQPGVPDSFILPTYILVLPPADNTIPQKTQPAAKRDATNVKGLPRLAPKEKRCTEAASEGTKKVKVSTTPKVEDVKAVDDDVVLVDGDDCTRPLQVKVPNRTNPKVDWEDRIPMEIIYATESSSVRATPVPAPLKRRSVRGSARDVIDLC